eukprot:TRINITY_DN1241_c0_g2_i5.p1 TRINITY_DN1241_c0_g2~~TRINITY_DN1241_c0_g2_i5.p1  ORF type:complete len:1010 (-),score=318.66 TRINITY_DN1241_c0_g2_i5:37-3066(-)
MNNHLIKLTDKLQKISSETVSNIINNVLIEVQQENNQLSFIPVQELGRLGLVQLLVLEKEIKTIIEDEIEHYVRWLKSLNKFEYLMTSVFINLSYKGFCSAEEVENDGDNQGEGDDSGKLVDGTGIGEGQGVQNVSKQIEFEEQLLGMKNDKEEENQDENQEKQENEGEDDVVDMENDFKGKTSKQEQQKEGEEEDKKEDEIDEDKLDEEISEVDDTLDYKMWNKEDHKKDQEDEEDQKDEENEQEEGEENMREEDKFDFNTEKYDKENSEYRAKKDKQKFEKEQKRNLNEFDKIDEEDEQEKDQEAQEQEDQLEEEDQDDDRSFGENEPNKMGQKFETEEKEGEDFSINEEEQEEEGGEQEGEEGLDQEEEEEEGFVDALDQREENQRQEQEEDVEQMENNDVDIADKKAEDHENIDEEMEAEPTGKTDRQKEKEKKKDASKFGTSGKPNDGLQDQDTEEKQKQKGDNANKEMEEQDTMNENENAQTIEDSLPIPNKDMNSQQQRIEMLEKLLEESQQLLNEVSLMPNLNVIRENINEVQEDQQQVGDDQNEEEIEENLRNQEYEVVKDKEQNEGGEKRLMTNLTVKENQQKPRYQDYEKENDMQSQQQQPRDNKVMEEEFKQEQNQKNKQKRNQDKKNDEQEKPAGQEEEIQQEKDKDGQKNKEENSSSMDLEEEEVDAKLRQGEEPVKNNQSKVEEDDFDQEEFVQEMLQFLGQQLKDEEVQEGEDQNSSNAIERRNKQSEAWQKLESSVRMHSHKLSEELKMVFAPTVTAALKGDYRTGKRLNMKKIIPYIASNYRKDKIWMRRSKPSKRNYQILLALDDSLSMKEQKVGYLALQSLVTLSMALSKLEVGQVGIASISDGMDLLHQFEKPLTTSDCRNIMSHFSFNYESAYSADLALPKFLNSSVDLFKKAQNQGSDSAHQICFIISDGRFNKTTVKPLMKLAEENNQVFIMIIVDKNNPKDSITKIKSTNLVVENGKTTVKMKSYLEDFPFKYYAILKLSLIHI